MSVEIFGNSCCTSTFDIKVVPTSSNTSRRSFSSRKAVGICILETERDQFRNLPKKLYIRFTISVRPMASQPQCTKLFLPAGQGKSAIRPHALFHEKTDGGLEPGFLSQVRQDHWPLLFPNEAASRFCHWQFSKVGEPFLPFPEVHSHYFFFGVVESKTGDFKRSYFAQALR